MKYLSDAFYEVFSHKGYAICTAEEPLECGFFDYIIDDFAFYGQRFNTINEAINAIDEKEKNT